MKKKSEQGEVMLEGMIIIILTMFILIWLLGIGFIYYQRNLVTAITNDAASKVAATYNNPESDIIMGYISAESIANRDLYRWFGQGELQEVNEKKAESYVDYVLKKTNFSGTIDSVEVELDFISDSVFRKHIEVKTKCTFNTPFGAVLKMFGMDEQTSYEAIGRADCTDIIDYVTTVDFAAYQFSGNAVSGKLTKLINSIIKLFNNIYY